MTGGLFGRWAAALRDIVFSKRAVCLGCGSAAGCEEDWICPRCRKELSTGWAGAQPPPKHFDAAAYAYIYRGAAASIVRHMKYDGIYRLADFMAADMAKAYRAIEPTGADCVMAVPMHAKRVRQRGYNHAELLARNVAGILDLPYVDGLSRIRNTRQQARLSNTERSDNLKDAFKVTAAVDGRRVLLVDDVCTTGSTAVACGKVLRRAGAVNLYLLCYTVAHPGKRQK